MMSIKNLIHTFSILFIGVILGFYISYDRNLAIISINELNKKNVFQIEEKLDIFLSKNNNSISAIKKNQDDFFIEINESLQNDKILLAIDNLKKINEKPLDSIIQINSNKAKEWDKISSKYDISSIDESYEKAKNGDIKNMIYQCQIGNKEVKKQCSTIRLNDNYQEMYKRADLIASHNYHGQLSELKEIYTSTKQGGIRNAVFNIINSPDFFGLDNFEKNEFSNFLASRFPQEQMDDQVSIIQYFAHVDKEKIPEIVKSLNGNIPPDLQEQIDGFVSGNLY